MLVWAYHQKVSRLKNVAEKLKIRYGKNKTISVRVKGRLDPISYARRHLGQMKQDYNKFVTKNASVVVVTPHDIEKTSKYFSKNNLPFYGIPDPDHKVANLYKQQWKLTKLGLMPALFVIDRAGEIVFSYYSKNMKDIPANDVVIGVLEN